MFKNIRISVPIPCDDKKEDPYSKLRIISILVPIPCEDKTEDPESKFRNICLRTESVPLY
jgi:hypothetical protein